MGFGGGSGGGGSIAGSSDVALSNPSSNHALTYDGSTNKWQNSSSIVIVKWSGSSWGSYSNDPNSIRQFYSQNSPSATPPTFYSNYDVWFAHEDQPENP